MDETKNPQEAIRLINEEILTLNDRLKMKRAKRAIEPEQPDAADIEKLEELQARRDSIAQEGYDTDPGIAAAEAAAKKFESTAVVIFRSDGEYEKLQKMHRARGRACLLQNAHEVETITADIKRIEQNFEIIDDAKNEHLRLKNEFADKIIVAKEAARIRWGL